MFFCLSVLSSSYWFSLLIWYPLTKAQAHASLVRHLILIGEIEKESKIQSLLTYKHKLFYRNEKQILKTVVLLMIISSSCCVFCILFAIRRLFGCWSCLISWVIQTLNFQECGHYNSCLNSIFAASFEFYFRMFRTPWKAPERLPAFQTYCFLSPRCSSPLIAP